MGRTGRRQLFSLTGCLKRFIKATVCRELPTTNSFNTLHPAHTKGGHEGQARPLTGPGSSYGSR